MNNDPLLRDLSLFISIAKYSSFAAAGAELGISPAHVSKRVATLEQMLGCTLFNRTTRRVAITREGEAMLVWAQKILDDVQAMLETSHGDQAEPKGLLRISTSQRLGRLHIAPILALLRKRYPRLEVWLEIMDRRTDLIGEQFDIDIRVGDVNEPHLIAHTIAHSQRVLCAAPGYIAERGVPASLGELRAHDCLLLRDRDSGFGMWRLESAGKLETVKVTGVMASNHSEIVHEWAHDGLGIILASAWDVAASIEQGRLVRLLPAYRQAAHVSAVTAVRATASERIRVCLDFLSAQLREGPYALKRLPD